MKKTIIVIYLLALVSTVSAQNSKDLETARDSLNKLQRAELVPFITKEVKGNTTVESIDANKWAFIKNKYDSIYEKIKNDLINKPPTNKELYAKALLKELGTPEDQLEMIYNDMLNGTKLWLEKRTEIKNRFN